MAFTSGIPAALQPTQTKALYAGNYIDFTDSSFNMWAQQFLPDVYEQEVERYGNRSIGSFLRMVSAEMPSTSDQIIWTEQGRLHTRYANIVYLSNAGTMPTSGTTAATASAVTTGGNVGNFFVPTSQPTSLGVTTQGTTAVNFKKGQTVMIQAQTSATSAIGGTGAMIKGVVTNVSGQYFQIKSYGAVPAITTAQRFTALAYGSEFAKGSSNFTEKLDPSYATFTNSPVILKEHYSINGSDTAQIGWIEVTSENGASGYLWYLKSEHENRLRFEDYLEMSMVEGVKQLNTGATLNFYDSALTAAAKGTEGFFEAIEARGNVYSGFGAQAGGGGGALTDFDAVLVQLDKQGAIEENMLFLDRNLSLEIDDILAQQNGGYSGGCLLYTSDAADE